MGNPWANPNLDREMKKNLESKIEDFLSSGKDSYRFPAGMFNFERQYVHALCKKRGLISASHGAGEARRLTISRRQDRDQKEILPKLIPDNAKHIVEALKNYQEKAWQNNKQPKLEPKFRLNFHSKPSLPNSQYNKPVNKLQAFRAGLPIAEKKHEIVHSIVNSKVTIIIGETGSGKTTQVPQFILEDAEERLRPTRIYFSQPRRLATVTCASRIAEERGSLLGKEIGYQIRLDNRISNDTNLILCTHGVLLRTLVGSKKENREKLSAMVSHVILDEIHERDKNADFLLIELREMLKSGELNRLVLMSATIDVNFFRNYFESEGIQTEAVSVEGRTGQIIEKSLEDVLEEYPAIMKSVESQVKLRAREVEIIEQLELEEIEGESESVESMESEESSMPEDITKRERPSDCRRRFDATLSRISSALHRGNFSKGAMENDFRLINKMLRDPRNVESGQSKELLVGKTPRGENLVNLAARAAALKYLVMFVNENDDFSLLREKDKSGRDAISWIEELVEDDFDTYEEIMDFLYDHDPGIDSDDEESEDPRKEICRIAEGYEKLFSRTIDNNLVKLLVADLWQKKDFSNTGSILVFLPGYGEIKSLGLDLIEHFHAHNLTPLYDDESSVSPQSSSRNLFYLHSQINPRKQAEAFRVGKKKIILSTNIAETSVTIPDVDFIVDCGKQRMKSFEPGSAVSMWLTTLISKSSARQRAGRCGRLPGTTGTCYHLFSRKTFDEIMLNEQAPELVRIPIPEICLSAKMLGGDIKIEEFLSKAPDPPAQKTICNAVEELKALGAIEQNEDLTPLGRLLVDMPLDPRLGKAVLASVMLRCVDPVITIVTSLGYRDPFVIASNGDDNHLTKKFKSAMSGGLQSDHHLILQAFEAWNSGRKGNWPIHRIMSIPTLQYINDVRRTIFDHLKACNLRPSNENSHDWNLITACLSIGSFPNVGRMTNPKSSGRGRKQFTVISANQRKLFQVAKSSMYVENYQSSESDTNHWVIFDEMFQIARGAVPNLKTVTAVPVLPVALFGGIDRPMIKSDEGEVYLQWNQVNLKLSCPSHQIAVKFAHLHKDWNAFFNYALETRNTRDDGLVHVIQMLLSSDGNIRPAPNGSHYGGERNDNRSSSNGRYFRGAFNRGRGRGRRRGGGAPRGGFRQNACSFANNS